MWKPDHRRAADRRGLRYPSDLTDAEWVLVSRWSRLSNAAAVRARKCPGKPQRDLLRLIAGLPMERHSVRTKPRSVRPPYL